MSQSQFSHGRSDIVYDKFARMLFGGIYPCKNSTNPLWKPYVYPAVCREPFNSQIFYTHLMIDVILHSINGKKGIWIRISWAFIYYQPYCLNQTYLYGGVILIK